MMRIALFTACLALASCGGPETSQANNSQANMSSSASPATAGNGMAMVAMTKVSGADAARVMHDRHEGMETIGKNFKALNRELKDSSPDLGTVRSSAKTIANLSQKASGWFPQGTGPDVGKTGAKPEIWQNPQDFTAKLRSFQAAAKTFNASAAGGDLAAIKTRAGELGQTCKACHDKYRAEMKH